jgi:hypothetical protein
MRLGTSRCGSVSVLRPEALVIVLTATRRDERDSIVFLTPHNMPRNRFTCRMITRRFCGHCWYLRLRTGHATKLFTDLRSTGSRVVIFWRIVSPPGMSRA